jgi:hypothetical protein
MRLRWAVLAVALVMFSGCLEGLISQPQSTQTVYSYPENMSDEDSAAMHNAEGAAMLAVRTGAASLYPNPQFTSGHTRTDNVSEICTVGYTERVRDVPDGDRKAVFEEYNVSFPKNATMRAAIFGMYEVDHFIPLALGGSNDISNLWLQPRDPRPGYKEKDRVETYLHKQVCDGTMSLEDARQKMRTDWYGVYQSISGGANPPGNDADQEDSSLVAIPAT